jgi:hypothetical protein
LLGIFKPKNNGVEKTYESKKMFSLAMRRSLIFSALLHVPIFAGDSIKEVMGNPNIVYATKEWTKGIVNAKYSERWEYKDQLREAINRGENVDLGNFYLRMELMEGRIDEARMEDAKVRLGKIELELKAKASVSTKKEILNAIILLHGTGSIQHSYLSTLLLDKKGNCHARQKLTATLVQRIYPDMPIQYQILKIDGIIHTRALVELEDGWYSIEVPSLNRVNPEAMNGTVFYESDDEMDYYVGKEVKGKYINKKREDFSSPVKIELSDDLGMPILPSPVGIRDIRNFDSFTNSNVGNTLDNGKSGTGASGHSSNVQINGSRGMGIFFGAGEKGWGNPAELETVSQEQANKLVEISKKWDEYLNVQSPPAFNSDDGSVVVLPDIEPDKDIEPDNGDIKHSWESLLSGFMRSLLNNAKEITPVESIIVQHSLFQNYFLWEERLFGNDLFKFTLQKICHSPELQQALYTWASPYLKKAFVALDKETRTKHLQTLLHLREYLKNYDYQKERNYLKKLHSNKDDYFFVHISPEEYYDRKYYHNVNDYRIIWYEDLDKKGQEARRNRYAETFVFRRIEMGMTVQDVRRWVEQGIQDMQSLIDKPQVKF